ncbi:MAG: GntR family transcriptional regulator [Nitrospiraceae bacterium]|nr:MAG: GntR family transcriptional regulator [Nitrospiraceae bacterium]
MLNKNTIYRETPEKLYMQLYNILRRKIESGEWATGSLLPTEKEISILHQVSVITVRTAMSHLVKEGFLIRTQGKGTFVKDWKQSGNRNYGTDPKGLEAIFHEVNNPLAIIGEKAGLLGELLEEEKGAISNLNEYRKALRDIKQQISRAKKTTHGLTDLPQRIEVIKTSREKGGKK